ncbi:MAG TPA: peptidoglycan-binding protein [Pyrinomonadaceae bacterium]|nr:peptidoglycan-binding protein [Pyrinomonadaceae bacterium]
MGTPDGVAGPRTIEALRKFQTDKQLPVTGTFDETTLGALGLGGGKTTLNTAQGIQTAPIALTDTINALAYMEDQAGPVILAATNLGLYRSADPVKGWAKLPFGPNVDARTLCVSTSTQMPQTIWVGTSKSGVLVSRDGGQTWEQVAGITSAAPVNTIVQDPQRPAYIYVGTTQQLLLSHDGGEKWIRRGGNLPYGSYTAILINPTNPDEMFVGSAYEHEEGNGVFHSADAGMTWKRIDPDLPSRRVWALAFDQNDPNRLLVGSHSAGVYLASRNGSTAAVGTK